MQAESDRHQADINTMIASFTSLLVMHLLARVYWFVQSPYWDPNKDQHLAYDILKRICLNESNLLETYFIEIYSSGSI